MSHKVLKIAAACTAVILLLGVLIAFVKLQDERSAASRAADVHVLRPVHRPFFTLNPTDREKLLEKAKTLQVGDSADRVLQVLGKPTLDQISASKTIPPAPSSRSLTYCITIYEKDLVNELHDEYVNVDLGSQDRVREVYRKLK